MQALTGFKNLEQLHIGANTLAYRGIRINDQKRVILKMPRTDKPTHAELEGIQKEYQLLKQIQSPGVIKAFELISNDQSIVLVMEDMDGQPLKQFLSSNPLTLDEFFKIALQLVNILEVLQKHHIIHKDIKPDNIIIEPKTLTVKLADFSISSMSTAAVEATTNPDILEGTLAYMSPEQTGRTNHNIDYYSDFYSLGVTLYEMLTNKLPFNATDPIEMVHCHLAVTPPLASKINKEIPVAVAQIVAKLMAKLPEERYSSAKGLYSDLNECYEQWKQKQQIDLFELGLHDVHTELRVSHKLYGREEQITQLMQAYEQASKGSTELVLVSGYSGIGKSSLIKELQKPILRQHGYYISGKFEKLKRDIPYSAIINAFYGLIKQILMQPEARFNQIKQKVLDAVEPNGQLIIDVLPSLELLIDKQPAVPELPIAEAQNRFETTLQNFIRVFSQKEHPLAILLDDLQWADVASLNLISHLLNDTDTHYLLIIGAYRDNEVDVNHPLYALIEKLSKENKITSEVKLMPLSIESIQQLLADTLKVKIADVARLAAIVASKTAGNPFFIIEFLKTLCQENLLQFESGLNRWNWDNESVNSKTITNNVVDLVLARIKKLPAPMQQLLKLASIIGANFTLRELAVISQQKPGEIFEELQSAVDANLIVPLGKSYYLAEQLSEVIKFSETIKDEVLYKFTHDRIQQAAYEMLSEVDKKQTHLQIARIEADKKAVSNNDERLFSILNHYDYSFDLLTDSVERLKVAEYNFWAGLRAKNSTAYAAAIQYFKVTAELLPQDLQENKKHWRFELYKELMESSYLVGDLEAAEKYFQIALSYVSDKFDLVEIYRIKVVMLKIKGKYEEGIDTGIAIMNKFGFVVPKKVTKLHVLKELIQLKLKIGFKKIQDLKFKPTTDEFEKILVRLGSEVLSLSALARPALFGYLEAYSIRRALNKGYGFNLKANVLMLGVVLMAKLNRFKEGFQWIELAETIPVLDAGQEVSTNVGKAIYVNHWMYPMPANLEKLLQVFHSAQDVGRLNIANAVLVLYATSINWLGNSMTEQMQAAQRALDYSTKINDYEFYSQMKQLYKCEKYLFEREVPTEKQLNEIKNDLNASGSHAAYFTSCVQYAVMCYMFGYYDEAVKYLSLVKEHEKLFAGRFIYLYRLFYVVLAMSANYAKVDAATKHSYHKEIKRAIAEIKIWFDRNPDNFRYYYLLATAELARIEGKESSAMELYDNAILAAQELNNTRLIALTNECAGNFYTTTKKQKFAKFYFQEAHYAYQRWEAFAKAKQLELQYPVWLQSTGQAKKSSILTSVTMTSTTTSNVALDLLSAVKATQAISSEIELEKLLQKLLAIVLENAGGQRAVLMTKHDDQWVVEAEGTREKQTVTLVEPEPIESRYDLPLSLISYVIRSQKRIVVQDSSHPQEVLLDPYIKSAQPKSMLVMPIIQQGQLKTILYLENNLISGAFTEEHINTLTLLASQAAISLENALLYYQATHDPLTGLANRNLLHQTFKASLSRSLRERTLMAVMFLDVDYFKQVNDTMGHEVGDKLLIHLSQLLKACLREDDLASRLGGDEFVVLLKDIQEPLQAVQVADRIYKKLADTVKINGHELHISSSMGISMYPQDGSEMDVLLQHADEALYRSKQQGRNRYQFYKPEQDVAEALP